MSTVNDAAGFLRAHQSFVVLGHREPDGDCVASQITVSTLAAALGKTASIYSVGPFDRPEIEEFAERFTSVIPPERLAGAAAIIVDCSTPDRTGELGAASRGCPALSSTITPPGRHSGRAIRGFRRAVDDDAPVLDLFEELGVPVDPVTARSSSSASARTRASSGTSAPTARRPSRRSAVCRSGAPLLPRST